MTAPRAAANHGLGPDVTVHDALRVATCDGARNIVLRWQTGRVVRRTCSGCTSCERPAAPIVDRRAAAAAAVFAAAGADEAW